MNDDLLRKWAPRALALRVPPTRLKLPLHVLASEALDVVRFCQSHWEPVVDQDGEGSHAGLRSAVGGGEVSAELPDELLELHSALLQAQDRYRLLARSGGGLLGTAMELLDELRATLRWAFDDGKNDEVDAQLANLGNEHPRPRAHLTVAAALFDYAELADRHRERLAGLGGFDVRAIDEAREVGNALRERTGPKRVTREERAALELRNRIGALLMERMRRARAAAKLVFRNHPKLLHELSSDYWREVRAARNSRRRAAEGEGTRPPDVSPPPTPPEADPDPA